MCSLFCWYLHSLVHCLGRFRPRPGSILCYKPRAMRLITIKHLHRPFVAIMPMRKRSVIPATACWKCSEEMFRTRTRTLHAIVRSPLPSPWICSIFTKSSRRSWQGISDLGYVGDLYGETNRALFAEAYNSFVKITLWFGGEVRNTLQCSADKNCGCQHT